MNALNELVIVLSAPLMGMFILLALLVRRYGAFHWVAAVVTSWLAGFVEILGPAVQPVAIALGSLSTVLFATGAFAYAGGRMGMRSWLASLLLPIGLSVLTAFAGASAGYAGMAGSDVALMLVAAWWTWPRGDLRTLSAAHVLPWSFVAFVPPDLYYQISRILGADMERPTIVVATGLISLSAILLVALTARMARDQTLVRQGLEERLVEREGELEESLGRVRSAERLATVGTLAAGIAHQINNPVGAILAAAQFELSDTAEGTGGEGSARATLETIEREALRCARIVRSVLLFARSDPGQVAEHDLNEIVASALLATGEYAGRRGASVDVALWPTPIRVRGNAIELEQVLVNLIRNGIESRARDARVQIRVEQTAAHALLIVRDNGAGLSEETKRRLFEPFYTTKLREGGSGLGLSVVHGILMTHGGEIELMSDAEPGTGFRVILPCSP